MHKHTHNSQMFLGCDLEGIQEWKNKHLLEEVCGGGGVVKLGMEEEEAMEGGKRGGIYPLK